MPALSTFQKTKNSVEDLVSPFVNTPIEQYAPGVFQRISKGVLADKAGVPRYSSKKRSKLKDFETIVKTPIPIKSMDGLQSTPEMLHTFRDVLKQRLPEVKKRNI